MKVRLAVPDEAPALWNIRNQAIRNGCRESYAAAVLEAWTPDTMPEGYRHAVRDNPFLSLRKRAGARWRPAFLISARPAWKPSLRCPNGAEKVAPE